ncbi:MAG: 2Fe-2S iron-sulfur cluster-binding protein [Ginsengibacter sp.]
MYQITFKFLQKGLDPVTIKEVEPDQSILEIALDNDINLHCDCGGVCACSTCHSYIEEGEEHLPEKSEREEDFISMALEPRENSRLSCQCVLEEGEGEIVVVIPDQTQDFDD